MSDPVCLCLLLHRSISLSCSTISLSLSPRVVSWLFPSVTHVDTRDCCAAAVALSGRPSLSLPTEPFLYTCVPRLLPLLLSRFFPRRPVTRAYLHVFSLSLPPLSLPLTPLPRLYISWRSIERRVTLPTRTTTTRGRCFVSWTDIATFTFFPAVFAFCVLRRERERSSRARTLRAERHGVVKCRDLDQFAELS